MAAIKVEPASDDETDTVSSVHDFLQINIKNEFSVPAEAETSEVQVCSVSVGFCFNASVTAKFNPTYVSKNKPNVTNNKH
jgi:hypothetical protein